MHDLKFALRICREQPALMPAVLDLVLILGLSRLVVHGETLSAFCHLVDRVKGQEPPDESHLPFIITTVAIVGLLSLVIAVGTWIGSVIVTYFQRRLAAAAADEEELERIADELEAFDRGLWHRRREM
ncbi:MAG: hypothetical protein ABFE08_14770 [Armatimonadia bacterium]